MAILTKIGGVPLFSAINEALAWARVRRLNSYHVHYWKGQKGYMGGVNHSEAAKRPASTNVRQTTRTRQTTTTQTTQTTPSPPVYTTRGGGGGGGY